MNPLPIHTQTHDHRWHAPAALVLLVGTILGIAWYTEGTLAAQRIMVDLAMPIGLAWMSSFFVAVQCFQPRLCLKRGLTLWRQVVLPRVSRLAGEGQPPFQTEPRQQRCLPVALILFLGISILFSPIVSSRLFRRLEMPASAISPLDPGREGYRAVVVLGGGTSLGSDGKPQFHSDGQRVAMAAQMWHANRVAAIICTGTDNYIPDQDPVDLPTVTDQDLWNPARQSVDLLVSLGIPKDKLYRIEGIHTSEEMQSLAKFLKNPPDAFPDKGPIGLITSAYHIPRAMRLARREGLDLIPIPVGFRTGPGQSFSVSNLVPSVNAGTQLAMAAREYLARFVGR